MKLFSRILVISTLIFSASLAWAQNSFNQDLSSLFGEEPEFLKVDEAFQFDFSQQDDKLKLVWTIADGYYLYKEKFKFASQQAELGHVPLPPGKDHEDEYFGKTEIYLHQVVLTVPVKQAADGAKVKIRYQGCAEAGLCYPPETKEVELNEVLASIAATTPAASTPPATQQDNLAASLSNLGMAENLLIFFVLGIGLAFTPCVFPMYPILSGIIAGQGKKLSLSRGFSLSFVYVQGMAITYSLLGLVVATAGAQYQAALQHPYVLIGLSIMFVLLSLSMFGLYDLRMPSSWQEKFNNASNQQKGGQYKGVFLMGVISGLVASPCTTAPLTGALLYIAQSGDLWLGGATLYALSLGMGIPLIVLGTSGGKILPKAGAWMNTVKAGFGFILLAVPVFLLERIVDPQITTMLWAILVFAGAAYLLQVNQSVQNTFWQGTARAIAMAAMFGAFIVGYQAWQGQEHGVVVNQGASNQVSASHGSSGAPFEFIMVKTLDELDQQVAIANAQGKSVMLDLYADWCVACKEFEHKTFPDPQVLDALSNTVWIQADLTASSDDDIAFMEHFGIFGLPSILFFNLQGEELSNRRVTGFMWPDDFAMHVRQTL